MAAFACFMHLFFLSGSIYLQRCVSIHPSIYPQPDVCPYLSIHPSIHPFIHPSIIALMNTMISLDLIEIFHVIRVFKYVNMSILKHFSRERDVPASAHSHSPGLHLCYWLVNHGEPFQI